MFALPRQYMNMSLLLSGCTCVPALLNHVDSEDLYQHVAKRLRHSVILYNLYSQFAAN